MKDDRNVNGVDDIRIDRIVFQYEPDQVEWQQKKPGTRKSEWYDTLREAFARAADLVLRQEGGGNVAIIVRLDPDEDPPDVLIGTPK